METLETLRAQLLEREAECRALRQQAAAAQESSAVIIAEDRQEIERLQRELHRVELEKLQQLKASHSNHTVGASLLSAAVSNG